MDWCGCGAGTAALFAALTLVEYMDGGWCGQTPRRRTLRYVAVNDMRAILQLTFSLYSLTMVGLLTPLLRHSVALLLGNDGGWRAFPRTVSNKPRYLQAFWRIYLITSSTFARSSATTGGSSIGVVRLSLRVDSVLRFSACCA